MEKIKYKYDLITELKSVRKDFSQSQHVPDDVCLNDTDWFYVCMCGAGDIHNYSFSVELLDVIKVPVKNTTKCVLIDNMLIVTSAKEDVSDKDLKIWPKSGQTQSIKLRHSKK